MTAAAIGLRADRTHQPSFPTADLAAAVKVDAYHLAARLFGALQPISAAMLTSKR